MGYRLDIHLFLQVLVLLLRPQNAALPSFTFGVQSECSGAESAAASQFILGRTEEKQDSVTSAAPLVFGKKADTEESKTQPIFSVGKSEHTKEESTAKPMFNFSFVKPSEKEPEQAKAAFSFGVQTSTSGKQNIFCLHLCAYVHQVRPLKPY